MNHIETVEKIRKELLRMVNQRCDELIQMYQNSEKGISPKEEIRESKLGWGSPAVLKGKKPVSVKFVSGETIETSTWKKVVQAILKHCNKQPDMHERLMWLRGRVFGRQRIILGEFPEEMDVPIQIDEGLYFEGKFDTEALITMMRKKVLEPVGYDSNEIVIQYIARNPMILERQSHMRMEDAEDIPDEAQGSWMEIR